MSALYVDFHGLVRVSGLPLRNIETESRYLAGLGLAELMPLALTLNAPRRGQFMSWLWREIVAPRIEADALLVGAIAEIIRSALRNVFDGFAAQFGESAARGTLQQQFYEFPEPLRNELARYAEFAALAGVSLGAAITIGSLVFNPDEFFDSAARAFADGESGLTTMQGSVQVRLEVPPNPPPGTLILNSPETLTPLTLREADFELLSGSVTHWTELLRHHPEWFDTSAVEFEQAVAEVASIESPRRRVEAARTWRKSSLQVRYVDIWNKARLGEELEYNHLLPPSGVGLLRHFQLEALAQPAAEVSVAFETAAAALIESFGLDVAIERLAGFPIRLASRRESWEPALWVTLWAEAHTAN